jgi:hypothetical protein
MQTYYFLGAELLGTVVGRWLVGAVEPGSGLGVSFIGK